ncbi:hypothetical protein K458DRAFT_409060 [Lentithecium fluviatile CBS 122367]|uniref:Uncharacterized protein n=1 Tax=Lentithecium fluviatile CBS 122367 TaxID=1168545 RepID=A0A6G1IK09_9PLEO|nr:hypothetical protein K458DRAFT_409060 [Lentithecium fluviatile CBS 122367]
MEFDSLPRKQQDLIRDKVIMANPVQVTNSYLFDTWFLPPKLASIPRPIQDIARKVFYEQNTFHFAEGYALSGLIVNQDIAKSLRKIGVDGHCDLGRIAKGLTLCTNLQEVEIGVDEALLVQFESLPKNGHQVQRLRPQDISFELNRLVLRASGVQALRRLRFPKVRFTPLIHSATVSLDKRRNTGPVPGGVLETIVAKEMMGPGKSTIITLLPTEPKKRKAEEPVVYIGHKNGVVKRRGLAAQRKVLQRSMMRAGMHDHGYEVAGTPRAPEPAPETKAVQRFSRFLDLPPELRNRIYSFVLCGKGPINPSTRPPTSSYTDCRVPKIPTETPHSALALLQTNKQVFQEAVGIYYGSNAFVFYYPIQSMMFLESISGTRKSYIKNITLWYKQAYQQGGMHFFDFALLQLSNLLSLEHLEILLDETIARNIQRGSAKLPGEERLRQMTKAGVTLTCRCPEGDVIIWHNYDEAGNRIESGNPYRRLSISEARLMIEGAKVVERRVTQE